MLNVSTISEHLSYVSGLSIRAHGFKRGLGSTEGTFLFLFHLFVSCVGFDLLNNVF